VASAIRAYVAEKRDTAAILRCLGATGRQVLAIYVLEAAGLGLLGAALGTVLGVGAQFALPLVMRGFIPVDVQVRLEPRAIVAGLSIGVWIAVLFALRPLLALRHVSPLEAIRSGSSTSPRLWRDIPHLLATVALAGSVAAVAVIRGGDVRQGLGMAGGLAVALGVLALSAALLAWLARRVPRARWPFVARQG
jgi:putative ABC transport system permease protein